MIAPFIRTAAADLHGLDSAPYRAIDQALRAGRALNAAVRAPGGGESLCDRGSGSMTVDKISGTGGDDA